MDADTPSMTNEEIAALADQPIPWTVLCVDDEPNILAALRRLLRGETGWRFRGAGSGAEALEILANEPVDVIISDMRMPQMDGAQFLEQARELRPDVGRLLLTGEADMASTMAAINRGEIYRYITKPWNDAELVATVRQALERRELLRERQKLLALTQAQNEALAQMNAGLEQKVAERTAELKNAHDRLAKNYLNSIKAFSSLIDLRSANMVGHARRVADIGRRLAAQMGLSEAQQREIFVAGLLHDIGQIGLTDAQLEKPFPKLAGPDLSRYLRHTVMGEQVLLALEDMQAVSQLIRSHHERYDGEGFPDKRAGDAIPIGAAILAVADAFDDLQTGHLAGATLSKEEARTIIHHGRGKQYHPDVIDALIDMTKKAPPAPPAPPVPKTTGELVPGMVLAKELVSAEGVVLLAAGQALNLDLIERIRAYERRDELSLVLMIKR